jgi:methylated-DNA-[protein]-cysteine S-methyltransferase
MARAKPPRTEAPPRYALFDTALGACAIAWNEVGVVAVRLPDATAKLTERALLADLGEATPSEPTEVVAEVISRMVRHLAGEPQRFDDVQLDERAVPPFFAKVYGATRAIPSGATQSYGQLAWGLGSKGASRAVGQALARNPFPVVVPCHRVLAQGGAPGGFSGAGGLVTKAKLLELEGAAPLRSLAVSGRRSARRVG